MAVFTAASYCLSSFIKPTVCFWFTDGAFLARQRAKADAEFYTAQRTAEANKVKTQTHIPPQTGTRRSRLLFYNLNCVVPLAAEVNTRVPAAHEVQGHRSQQQNLLWERHTPDVCGLWLCRELDQGLCSHGHCCWADHGPGLAMGSSGTYRTTQGWRTVCRRAGAWPTGWLATSSLWPGEALQRRARISQTPQNHC